MFIILEAEERMDPDKVSTVASWPTPSCQKDVQCFLGFANFYRELIRNLRSIAAPLDALTSSKSRFSWDSQAETAFLRLWRSLTTAHVLDLPDPSLQFVVQVDASDLGIIAILFKRSIKDNKLHPCSLLFKSSAEKNYDVGECELLAIRVTFKGQRHWLEGAKQPFLVWTDHEDLDYLRTAKRLNARQARLSTGLTPLSSPAILESRGWSSSLTSGFGGHPSGKRCRSMWPPAHLWSPATCAPAPLDRHVPQFHHLFTPSENNTTVLTVVDDLYEDGSFYSSG